MPTHAVESAWEEEEKARCRRGSVEGEMCSDNWNTSNDWEDQHKVCYSVCFDHNLLTPVSRYCAILLMQMVVLVRMAVCVQQDTGTRT